MCPAVCHYLAHLCDAACGLLAQCGVIAMLQFAHELVRLCLCLGIFGICLGGRFSMALLYFERFYLCIILFVGSMKNVYKKCLLF